MFHPQFGVSKAALRHALRVNHCNLLSVLSQLVQSYGENKTENRQSHISIYQSFSLHKSVDGDARLFLYVTLMAAATTVLKTKQCL